MIVEHTLRDIRHESHSGKGLVLYLDVALQKLWNSGGRLETITELRDRFSIVLLSGSTGVTLGGF